jgi:hypothetical protein
MMNIASESWRPVVAGDKIVTANPETIGGVEKRQRRRVTVCDARSRFSMRLSSD